MKSQLDHPKILYLITQGEWGGAQRYVFDLSSKINEIFIVSVAVGKPKGLHNLADTLKNNSNINCSQLKHLQRAINPYHDIRAIFELRQLYKNEQPDIVHLNSSKAGIIGSLAAIGLKNRPKIVYTVHGWVFREALNWFAKNTYLLLEKWTAHYKDSIIVLSPEEKNSAETILKIPAKKLTVIPLGIIPPSFLPPTRARAKISELAKMPLESKLLVGTIAHLYKNKGIDILIKAVAQLTKNNPNAHFVIIGAGPEELNLKKLIVEQKINHVHLVGSYENAAELLPGFDLFVLPSRKEGTPYTILEAMAAGLPIVATAVGGIKTLLQNYSASWITKPDPNQLAGSLADALKNPKKGMPMITPIETTIKQTIALYQKLLEK